MLFFQGSIMKPKRPICIGLMGQLASGKSTVATYFQELGISVISADAISRELTAKNTSTCAGNFFPFS